MATRFTGTPGQKAALNAFIKLMRATAAVENSLRETFGENKITPSQFAILEAIYHLGPLKQAELAKKILKTSGNVTKVIDNLEKSELVIRTNCPDRRAYEIHLTEKGKTCIEKILPNHIRRITQVMNSLNEKELRTIEKLSKKLGLGAERLTTKK